MNGVRATIGPGRNRIPVDAEDVATLRVTITEVDQPPGDLRGNGGLREIRIPGVRCASRCARRCSPAQALGGRDLSRVGLTYLFERTTADEPFRRDRQTGSPLLELAKNRDRRGGPDRPRGVRAGGARLRGRAPGCTPRVDARDSELDRLAGVRSASRFDSSGRFHNLPRLPRLERLRRRAGHRLARHLGAARPPRIPGSSGDSGRPLELSRLRLGPPPRPRAGPARCG